MFTQLGAFPRAAPAAQHVGTGDLVVAAAHEAEFDRILHIFDMKGAAIRRDRTMARITACVSWSTVSRTLADAAPCVPCTARNAFIIAMAILFGNPNGTTAPLRRMICQLANALALALPATSRCREPAGTPRLAGGVFRAVCIQILDCVVIFVLVSVRQDLSPAALEAACGAWRIAHYI